MSLPRALSSRSGPTSGRRTWWCSRRSSSPSTSSTPTRLASALLAFVVFCALAGAVYLVNDLVDVERDRLHPVKRTRPLASGALPPQRRARGRGAAVRRVARGVLAARPGLPGVRARVPRAQRRLLARAQARRDPRRARGRARLRAARGGGRRRDRRPLQRLAARLHDPARALPGARQAAARARDARRRRRPTARSSPSTARTCSTR